MSTFCHGVASAQSLDKSGEIVDIKGLDITSLPRTGVLNYEHKSDIPGQICGKILTAKKIFSKEDCSNENELYFWEKTKNPFVYITAELLDDYCQSGKDAAGLFRYDHDKKDQNSHAILGFSVEGSEIPNTRKGMLITRSIARKVTLTASPCNSQCIAEMLVNTPKSQVKDDFDSIFKSSEDAITLFKSGEGEKIYENFLAKKEVKPAYIGLTKSGKHVFSNGSVDSYNFSPSEHKEASEIHSKAAVTAEDSKSIDNHIEKMKEHNKASLSSGKKMTKNENKCGHKKQLDKSLSKALPSKVPGAPRWRGKSVQGPNNTRQIHLEHPKHGLVTVMHNKESNNFEVKHSGTYAGVGGQKGIFPTAKEAIGHAKKYMGALDAGTVAGPQMHNIASGAASGPTMTKAIEAGSYNAAPSTLTGGAAYQVESMGSKQASTGAEEHKFHGTKKKDWNKRAKDDYENWPHKEKFESFMKARMPHLAEGEIRAIGRALALKKSLNLEKSLNELISLSKK